jgi:hypothetical protein
MRSFEWIVGIIFALIIFAALKIIGLVIKFALIAAVIGFIAGLLIARAFRSKAS